MFKTLTDKVTLSGTIVLTIGVALLIFTFASAYGFLAQGLSILTSSDLVQTFGEALAPLVVTCIHIMYLGVMGWIGSLLTIRGVTIISQARQMPAIPTQEKAIVKEEIQAQPVRKVKAEKPQTETKQPEAKEAEPKKPEPEPATKPEAKPEAKPYEPEIVVMTPEEAPRTQQKTEEPKKESQQSQAETK